MPDRLTSLDAAFYHLERLGQQLHIAGVQTVDGTLDHERLIADIENRLHLIPRYTQRVVPVPLNLAQPSWEPDPHFDVRNHVLRHKLRPPGDDTQLVTLVGRLFAQPLDRDRPLWEVHQIDGYRGERSVLFSKVHHCMVDGVSGVELMFVLFDPSPKPAPVTRPENPPAIPPLPGPSVQVVRALTEAPAMIRERARDLLDVLRDPQRALGEMRQAAEAMGELARLVLAPAPTTPFNGHVSVLRRVFWVTFPLNAVKAIKNRLGGTVNDVVLALITGALRAYLEDHGEQPDRTELRAMVPVSVRPKQEQKALGNRVSAMMAPLPIGIFDPIERLRQVRGAMAQLKQSGEVGRMTRMLELMNLLPPLLQKPLGWMQIQAAPVNTICTNVPGPPVSLYVQGKRLETMVPIVPLAQGVGLAFAILSYADTLTIGVTTDPALVRDGDHIAERLRGSFEELCGLARVELRATGGAPSATVRPIRVA